MARCALWRRRASWLSCRDAPVELAALPGRAPSTGARGLWLTVAACSLGAAFPHAPLETMTTCCCACGWAIAGRRRLPTSRSYFALSLLPRFIPPTLLAVV